MAADADLAAALAHADAVERGRAVDALAARDDPAAAPLIAPLIEDEDWVVAFKAACALAWWGDDRGGPILIQALARADLCFMALQALTALGSEQARPGLGQFFERRFLHPLERTQAAAALHRSGDARGLPWLESRLAEGLPEERGLAIELWGQLALPQAYERLAAILEDEADPQRLDAVRGLAALGDDRALPLLRRVAADQRDPELADEAREAATVVGDGPSS